MNSIVQDRNTQTDKRYCVAYRARPRVSPLNPNKPRSVSQTPQTKQSFIVPGQSLSSRIIREHCFISFHFDDPPPRTSWIANTPCSDTSNTKAINAAERQ